MTDCLIFDTGPLSHFAKQQWLGALRALVGDRVAMIPDMVFEELHAGVASYPYLKMVLEAPWIVVKELTTGDELDAYATFAKYLVVQERNRGEAAVLALASTAGATAVLDDSVARKAADRFGVEHIGTLGLLCQAIRDGLMTAPLVAKLADDLIEGEYRLPFRPGGFEKWATDNGLLD